MPQANLLAQHKLEPFKIWLVSAGHEHRPGSGIYQVLQVRLKGQAAWQAVYRREDNAVHYSVPWPLVTTVEQFIRETR